MKALFVGEPTKKLCPDCRWVIMPSHRIRCYGCQRTLDLKEAKK